jgi:hypothetical protein
MVAGSGYDACRQTLAGKIGDTRWLLVQQLGQGTPKAFLALLNLVADLTVRQFWSVLFASFGLFAPRNLISVVALMLCALAVVGVVGDGARSNRSNKVSRSRLWD